MTSLELQRALDKKLMQKSFGSIEYLLTWKAHTTPALRQIYRLRASGRRKSDSAYGGWASPKASSGGPNSNRQERGSGGADLKEMAGWAAPGTRGSPETDADKQNRQAHTGQSLIDQAFLAGYATPNSRDWKSEQTTEAFEKERWEHPRGKSLSAQMMLAIPLSGWHTPDTMPDSPNRTSHCKNVLPGLGNQAMSVSGWTAPQAHDRSARGANQDLDKGGCADLNRDAASVLGQTTTSSPSKEKSTVALNAALSRWLQGYPKAWCQAAILANRMSKKHPKRAT